MFIKVPTKVDFNFITNRVATGGFIISQDCLKELRSHGITHIINCCQEFDDSEHFDDQLWFPYLHVGVDDDGQSKSVKWFKQIIEFGLTALSLPKNKIYCHCAMGINRGPSATYAILRAQGLTKEQAELQLRVKRPDVELGYIWDADAAIAELGYE